MAWEEKIYVASYIKTITDEFGSQIPIFSKPKPFYINHQPSNEYMHYQQYGSDISSIRIAYPRKDYVGGKIKTKDRVYLIDGDNYGTDLCKIVAKEDEFCNNANYEVIACQPSNLRMRIDFKKIQQK